MSEMLTIKCPLFIEKAALNRKRDVALVTERTITLKGSLVLLPKNMANNGLAANMICDCTFVVKKNHKKHSCVR